MIGLVMLGTMVILLALGVPVVFCIGLAAVVAIMMIGPAAPMIIVPSSMIGGMDSFPLMAIPFFILAGELMNRGGITLRLVNFANVVIGGIRGGLAYANVLTSMLFAGITGSALADTAAIGRIMIPAMEKQGYDRPFSTAVTVASSLIGPIIPPSITMVVYGVTAGVSIGGLFLGGFVPGLLVGLGLMALVGVMSHMRGYPKHQQRLTPRLFFVSLGDALVALMMPVIILGGIFGGIMTPTEAAAIAVVYALFVGFFVLRELKIRDLFPIFLRSGLITASILIIVGAARIASDLLAQEQTPQLIAATLFGLVTEPWQVMMMIMVFLLLVGAVIDTIAAIIIMVPILLPIAAQLGIDPITFGVIVCVNLIIGLATPPLGICLFVASGIAKLPVERLVVALWPFLLVQIGVLLLIAFVPGLVSFLPSYFGYIR
jgi:tripartite ATP-independent transporter DctM subunit